MTASVEHFLQVKAIQRQKRLSKKKTKEEKKKRNKRKYAKLIKDTIIAKKERARRAGTYRRGMNLDDIDDGDQQQRAAAPKKRKVNICPHPFCGLKGHMTTKSKKCKANPERLQREGQVVECAAALADSITVQVPVVIESIAPLVAE